MRQLTAQEIDDVTGGVTICVNHISAGDPTGECPPGAILNPPPTPLGNIPGPTPPPFPPEKDTPDTVGPFVV